MPQVRTPRARRSQAIPQPSALPHLPPEPAFAQARLDFAADTYPDSLEARFRRYDAAHPDVWREFHAMADRLYRAGVRHYGAKALFEAIRFHRAVDGRLGDDGEAWKVNNVYTSRYARKLVAEDPDRWGGFFSFRLLRSA